MVCDFAVDVTTALLAQGKVRRIAFYRLTQKLSDARVQGDGAGVKRTPLQLDTLCSAKDVMRLLGYRNVSAFWQFVNSSGFPRIRLNPRRIVFDPKAVESWLRQRAVGQHPDPILRSSIRGQATEAGDVSP